MAFRYHPDETPQGNTFAGLFPNKENTLLSAFQEYAEALFSVEQCDPSGPGLGEAPEDEVTSHFGNDTSEGGYKTTTAGAESAYGFDGEGGGNGEEQLEESLGKGNKGEERAEEEEVNGEEGTGEMDREDEECEGEGGSADIEWDPSSLSLYRVPHKSLGDNDASQAVVIPPLLLIDASMYGNVGIPLVTQDQLLSPVLPSHSLTQPSSQTLFPLLNSYHVLSQGIHGPGMYSCMYIATANHLPNFGAGMYHYGILGMSFTPDQNFSFLHAMEEAIVPFTQNNWNWDFSGFYITALRDPPVSSEHSTANLVIPTNKPRLPTPPIVAKPLTNPMPPKTPPSKKVQKAASTVKTPTQNVMPIKVIPIQKVVPTKTTVPVVKKQTHPKLHGSHQHQLLSNWNLTSPSTCPSSPNAMTLPTLLAQVEPPLLLLPREVLNLQLQRIAKQREQETMFKVV
ncbi:hypothetical protein PAXRUDRAFT_16054 [Paxillus rubicundulus Ve08.2h10]|uniref:Uncharacterized protein n=1 Tax=Paxillus rubicundulus Ve08.2h10 TaxID=930991 RepID=A0A0D0D8E8_9AGAM|nr:hypothetical protein PAXRUDRAFT_16054 [Paxillus rubicundulus Ve08.2h10]